jgi:hypothetical protein
MCVGRKLGSAVAVGVLVALSGGCGSGSGTSGGGKAFLDQKKEIGPRLEWNREITSKSGGTFTYRVTSQGPFAVTLINEKAYKALMGGNRKAFNKEDVLLTIDCKESTFEGKATIPAGSSWFIIENQTDKNVEMHLQCFAP